VIPLRDQEYIRERFERELEGRVRIDYFTQKPSPIIVPGREECAYCEDTRVMLEELAALADKISLTVHELAEAPEEAKKLRVNRVPGVVLRGPANRPLRFFGIPAGNEFPNFVETIIEASKTKVQIGQEASKHLKKIKDNVSVEVYVTPTCPYCPGVVRAAYRLALASPRIEASAFEVSEFPRLAQQLGIRAVPMTVLGGRTVIAGAIDEAGLAEQAAKTASGALAGEQHAGEVTAAAVEQPAARPSAPGSGLILPR